MPLFQTSSQPSTGRAAKQQPTRQRSDAPQRSVFPPEASDDLTLVRAARADPQAFGALYERYSHAIYRYAYARLRSQTAAEDATSDTFFKALQGLTQFRDGLFAAWLFRIAHNVVTDRHRRAHPTTSLDDADSVQDDAASPEEQAMAHSERAAMYRAMAALPAEQRVVLELQLTGMKGEEIAQALGKTHASVKMLLWRGLTALRVILAREGLVQEGERS